MLRKAQEASQYGSIQGRGLHVKYYYELQAKTLENSN